MNLHEQPALVGDLLNEVCQARVTVSAVTLAADLVDRGRLSMLGDPVSLVTAVVEELGEAGLLTYNLRYEWGKIPLRIKATPLGFKLAGYERETKEVGTRAAKRGKPLHLGPTDFRSQPDTTWGGSIERMSLVEHLDIYPDHKAIHPHPWECGPYSGDVMSHSAEAMARRKQDRAERLVDTIRELGGTATFTQIEAHASMSPSVASRYVDDAKALGLIERVGEANARGTYWRLITPETEEETTSSRETILEVLRDVHAETDRALMARMARHDPRWRSLGFHSLDHQLFSMEKAGLIEMDVKRAGNVQRITNIRLPKTRSVLVAEIEVPPMPTYEDVMYKDLSPVVPVSDADLEDAPAFVEAVLDVLNGRYPILTSLLDSQQARDETSRRADAYLAAASALDGVAQEESDRLMALANDLANGVALSPVEAEYLRFAQDQEEL